MTDREGVKSRGLRSRLFTSSCYSGSVQWSTPVLNAGSMRNSERAGELVAAFKNMRR